MSEPQDDVVEAQLGSAIREFALGEEAPSTADDESVAAVVDRFEGGRRGRAWFAPPVPAVLAVAAAAGLVLWFGSGTETSAPRDSPELARSVQPDVQAPQVAAPEGFRVERGSFDAAGVAVALGDRVAANTKLRGEAGGCLGFADASFCMDGPAVLVIGERELILERGKIRVRTPEGLDAPSISTVRGVIEPRRGEHTVSVDQGEGSEPVVVIAVIAGMVNVTEPDATHHAVSAPETLTLEEGSRGLAQGGLAPVDEVPSAAELLERAQTERAAGHRKLAAKTYRMLIRHHADSKEARSALVSLGQLELDLGRAGAAIKAFDRYLRDGGLLAEDAHFGKIRALRKLGRSAEERAAIEVFVRKHPDSPYRESLEERLDEKDD
jgi:hypothetical protein